MFVLKVAKQHDVFAGVNAFGVLVNARGSFCLVKMIRKIFDCFNKDLSISALVPQTDVDYVHMHIPRDSLVLLKLGWGFSLTPQN